MEIAYILPVNMKNYGYTKDNFIKTHFSVDIAREAAKEYKIALYTFWDEDDFYEEKNLSIYFFKTSLTKIFNSGFAEISLKLLLMSFPSSTVFHFHEPTRLFYPLFAFGKKNRFIIEHHGIGINNPFQFPSRFSVPFEIFKRYFLSGFLKKSHAVIVHNTLAKNNIQTYKVPTKKIVITSNGIHVEKYRIFDKKTARKKLQLKETLHIIFVGRVHKSKGIVELVKAFEEVKRTNSEIELSIVGPLDDVQLTSLVEPYWKGFKNPQELQIWLSAADIFCLPSYSEPFGIVLLEALYYNLPIITTDTAGPREFVPQKNALFIKPKNIQELQEALTKMSDKSFREKKTTGGHELIQTTYTWENICKQYISLYKDNV